MHLPYIDGCRAGRNEVSGGLVVAADRTPVPDHYAGRRVVSGIAPMGSLSYWGSTRAGALRGVVGFKGGGVGGNGCTNDA